MTGGEVDAKLLSQLQETLDIYGADRTRWPVGIRHTLSRFIADDARAQRMVADAEIFDRLLDQAPAMSTDRLAVLTDRIVADASRQPRIVTSRDASTLKQVRKWRAPAVERGVAAAAMAASLLLGVLAGQSQIGSQAAEYLIGEASVTQVAQFDDTDGFLDEDLL